MAINRPTLRDIASPQKAVIQETIDSTKVPTKIERPVIRRPSPKRMMDSLDDPDMAMKGENPIPRLQTGIGRIIRNSLYRGPQQIKSDYFDSPDDQKALRSEIDDELERDAPIGRDPWGGAGEVLGEMAMTAGSPATSLPRAALTGATYRGLQPMRSGELGEGKLAALTGRAMGAGRGAVENAAGYGVVKAGAKGVNAVRGKWAEPGLKRMDDTARSRGVDLTLGDLHGPGSGWSAAESIADAMPGSGRAARVSKQEGQYRDYLKKLLAGGDQFGGEEKKHIVDGVVKKYAEYDNQSEVLYNRLNTLLNNTGTKTMVRPEQFKKGLDVLAADFPSVLTQNNMVPQRVQAIISGIQDGSLKRLTFDEARSVRRALGGVQGQLEKQAATGSVNSEAVGKAKLAFKGIAEDMERWGRSIKNKKIASAFEDANTHFKTNILPYREDNVLNDIISSGYDDATKQVTKYGFDYDDILRKFVRKDEQGDVRTNLLKQLFGATDDTGQDALRESVKQTVLEPAMTRRGTNPMKAAENFDKYERGIDDIMPGQTADEMRTAADISDTLGRSDRFNKQPASAVGRMGRYALPTLGAVGGGAAGSMFGPVGTLGGAALGVGAEALTGRAINSLTGSRAGKNMMMASPQVLPWWLTGRLSNFGAEGLDDIGSGLLPGN